MFKISEPEEGKRVWIYRRYYRLPRSSQDRPVPTYGVDVALDLIRLLMRYLGTKQLFVAAMDVLAERTQGIKGPRLVGRVSRYMVTVSMDTKYFNHFFFVFFDFIHPIALDPSCTYRTLERPEGLPLNSERRNNETAQTSVSPATFPEHFGMVLACTKLIASTE